MSTAAAPAPDDFKPSGFADSTDAMGVLREAQGPVDVDHALARKLEAWFTASKPGPVPALPEDVRRFVPKGEAAPPLHRWRIVDGNVLERWEAVEKHVNSSDFATIALLAGQDRVIGWNVVRLPLPADAAVARLVIEGDTVRAYDRFGRLIPELQHLTGEQLREHVLSLSLAPEDDTTFNGYYPTLPGNDIAHYRPGIEGYGKWRSDMSAHQGGEAIRNRTTEDGYLRGGREIRGGRAEHREATKGMHHIDDGYQRDVDKIKAGIEAKRKAEGRLKIEKTLRAGPDKPNDV